MISPRITYQSSRGCRETNEDAYGIPGLLVEQSIPLCTRGTAFYPPKTLFAKKGYLFILADGVGGVAGGEIASARVVKDVGRRYYDDPSPDISVSLQRVIQAGNRSLRRFRIHHEAQQMATTIIAAVFLDNMLHIAGVGDSRAYLITETTAQRITHDHSWVEEHRNSNPHLANINLSANAHRITRSIGSHVHVSVDTWRFSAEKYHRILLCTDGLSNYVDDGTLFSISRQPDIHTAMNDLIDSAYDRGSTDNISAILIEAYPDRSPSNYYRLPSKTLYVSQNTRQTPNVKICHTLAGNSQDRQ